MLELTTLLAAEEAHGGDHGGGAHGPSFLGLMVYIALTLAIVFGFLAYAKKGLKTRLSIGNWATGCVEQLYHFIHGMTLNIIGPHGGRYVPMMMGLWMVIFVSNLISVFFPTAPTSDLSFNVALALISIGYVQYEGIRANGFFGHFSHFAGPKLPIFMLPITLMIFVVEILSEIMKNVSLSLRLFGNIEGGHLAVVEMNKLGKDIFIPVGAFLLPIKLLTCVVQALIFTLLTCVYLSLVTHHEDDHGHDDHSDATPAPAH